MDTRKMLAVQDLVLEITRKCNMACPHCMRGDAQNRSMTEKTMESILARTSRIRTLTFTGGEPSLRPDLMLKALKLAKKYHITVEQVYLVTNGKEVSELFLEACRQWQLYTALNGIDQGHSIGDKQLKSALYWLNDEDRTYGCFVAVSADTYHEPIPSENLAMLSTLPHLVEDKTEGYASDRHQDEYIIRTGRARENGLGQMDAEKMRPLEYRKEDACRIYYTESDTEYEIDNLFISANGGILKHCDYSYEDQERFLVGKIRHGIQLDDTWLDRVLEEHGQA